MASFCVLTAEQRCQSGRKTSAGLWLLFFRHFWRSNRPLTLEASSSPARSASLGALSLDRLRGPSGTRPARRFRAAAAWGDSAARGEGTCDGGGWRRCAWWLMQAVQNRRYSHGRPRWGYPESSPKHFEVATHHLLLAVGGKEDGDRGAIVFARGGLDPADAVL